LFIFSWYDLLTPFEWIKFKKTMEKGTSAIKAHNYCESRAAVGKLSKHVPEEL